MRQLVVLAVLLAACSSAATPVAPSPTTRANGALRVLVTAAEVGGAVVGAHVCAATAQGAETCADTGKDGAARIDGAPGTYFVRVSGPAEQRWAPAERVTDLIGGDAALWIEMAQLHRISGRIRDEDGAPVAGAEACAHPSNGDAPVCAKSGSDGLYAFDVRADVYRLQVTGASGTRLVSQWARGRVFLEEADVLDARKVDVPDVDVQLVRGVVLKGVIRLAGVPVEDAQVCIRTLAAPLPWDCERTDKKGQYTALREPGLYYMWTVPPANVRAVPQWFPGALTGVGSSAIRLASSDVTIDVALTSGPQVHGVLRTPEGEAVANALVCIDTAFTTGRICRETDGNGRYTITTRAETYIISVIPPAHSGLIGEYWDGKRTWNTADEITVNSDVTLDLTVSRGVTVDGTIKDTRGIPVAGATVNFNDARGVAAATDTDAGGHFEVVVRPGSFGVDAFPPFVGNLIGAQMDVDIRASMELAITLPDIAP